MNYLKWVLFLILFYPALTDAQVLVIRTVCQLPDTIYESSGLQAVTPARLLTHNDSGDQPRFFVVDTSGNLLHTRYLENATTIDVEDITSDSNGNIYLGDFGNNFNTRTDLKIYKISAAEVMSGENVATQIIGFNYPDQISFPPAPQEQNFDCEAFFYYRDSLYLFSKNRGTSLYSKMYRLPSKEGNYNALLVDSFFTGHWITSAAINPSATAFVLLSESNLFLYTGFANGNFSNAVMQQFEIDSSQKEGICFLNDTAIYITDEGVPGNAGNLYFTSLGNYIPYNAVPDLFSMQLFNNPSRDGFTLSLKGSAFYTLEIFDSLGKKIHHKYLSEAEVPFFYRRTTTGILFLRITSLEGQVKTEKVVIY